MKKPLRVLMVEDSESDAGLIIRRLQGAGYDLEHERVETAGDMRTALAKPDWDIVLADYKLPQFSASAALEILKESGRDLPFIIVSGTIGEEKAVALMKAGAHDYVMKHNLARLVPAVARELGEAQGRRERRQTEEALLKSEAALSSILRAAPIGIGLVTQSIIGWTNDHLSRMTGYSRGELQGQSARMLYESQAEFERVGQLKYEGINHQGTGSIETRWRRKDGKIIEVFLRSTPIDPLDLDAGVVFTAMDITDRQETIKALRESEERYRTLVENIDLGITLISSDYRVIMTNAAQAGLFQKHVGDIVGRECFREFEKRDGVCAHCPGTKAMATGKKAVVETTGVRDDGTRVSVRVQAFPQRGPDGRITGFIEVVEDISERKQMEAALQESENLYRSLFENMLNGFAYCKMLSEPNQPQDFIYLKVNSSFEALTGLKDVVGKRASEVIPGIQASDPELFEIYGRVASTGNPERFENYVEALKMWFSISVYSPGKGYFVAVFDVITERKRAEAALSKNYRELQETAQQLEQSRNMLQLIIESVPVRVFWKDSDLRYMGCNTLFARDAGLSHPEQLLGKDDFAMGWSEQADLYRADDRQVMESRRPKVNIVEPQTTPAGAKIWLNTSKVPLQMPNGEVFGVLGVYEDVTERKQAEIALRESEERFRLVFEKAPIGIMHYDQTSAIIDCNEKFVEIIGASQEKFIGFNMIWQLRDEKMREAVAASLRGEVGYYEGDYLSVTAGKLTPVRAIYQPIFSPEGVVSGGITIFEDITERQQAESELKLKERLLDSASDSIFLYDLEGNFLYINEAAYITRWYRKEELLSLGAWALGTAEAAAYQDNILRELRASGELIFESEHRRKDGSVMPVEIFARVLTVEGRELILSAVRDITERKQAETQVRQGLDKLHQALQGTVVALANTVEIKDPYTAGHQRRVAQLSCAMARELGWSPDRVEGIQVMCFLHDMGKIAVPAEILNRPGKISQTEFSLIKVHPQVGYDILKDIAFPWPVAQGVLQHHERLDGSGYPSGLTAGEITPEAKILAVADVVEAMASHRPYRPALGIEKAIEEITQNRGKLYDPDAVDVCVRLLNEKGFQFD